MREVGGVFCCPEHQDPIRTREREAEERGTGRRQRGPERKSENARLPVVTGLFVAATVIHGGLLRPTISIVW